MSNGPFDLSRHGEAAELAGQVIENCHRSDATFAGSFSLCGLLLRLRDLYKWEQGRPPWTEPDPAEVLTWIDTRENLWESLQDSDPEPLAWRGRMVDPFNSEDINRDLGPLGLYYGAGYAAFLKPSYVLAQVVKTKSLDGFRVVYLGDELARDLFASPAMTGNGEIVVRRGPLASYLWETILHGAAARRKAMGLALSLHGLAPGDLQKDHGPGRYLAMVDDETEPLVRHEYQEAVDENFPRDLWENIVGSHPHSRLELLARTIKDILADTGDLGRIKYIIDHKRLSSMAVFAAQQDGLYSRLFPGILEFFEKLLRARDWSLAEDLRVTARDRAAALAHDLADLAQQATKHRDSWLSERVEELFFEPLGL